MTFKCVRIVAASHGIRTANWAKLTSALASAALACLASAAGHAAPVESGLLPDALHRAAPVLSHPSRGVLLGVARAGDALVAVGFGGLIVVSNDSGRSWKQSPSPTRVSLLRVTFISPREGWIIGHMGVVLHSTDGGQHWQMQLDGSAVASLVKQRSERQNSPEPAKSATDRADNQPYNPYSIKAANQLTADGPDKPFLAIETGPPATLLVAGAYGIAMDSTDGGAHWAPAMDLLPDPQGLHIYGLAKDGDTALAVGEQGLLLRRQGDAIFQAQKSPYEGTFFGALATGDGTLYIYGLRGKLFRSTDRGNSWQPLDSGVPIALTSAHMLTNKIAVFGSLGGQVVAIDPGSDHVRAMASASEPVSDLVQAPDGTVVIVGPNGPERLTPGGH